MLKRTSRGSDATLLTSQLAKGCAGQRDFVILRLMRDLGLRGAEIVKLCLEDIDWRAGPW
jgi:integrase